MIITKTPMRVSFLGGGTDYPDYYRRHGGMTLCTSIDKYSYILVQRIFPYLDHRLRISYSKLERVNDAEEVQHPAVRMCLQYMGVPADIEVHYTADLPARTGMGSSSSFTVCLLHALHTFKGELVSQWQLAQEAIYLEQELLEERVGSQDQCIAALGGLRLLRFHPDGTIQHECLPIRRERLLALQDRLMLFYTGICRTANDILEEQLDRTRAGTLDAQLAQLSALVPQGAEVLCGESSLDAFGELLHEGWRIKQALSSQVATPEIAGWYARARAAGAIGGKLLGAGGGGFLLCCVPPERRDDVRRALPELREVPFQLEREGSTLLFYTEANG